MNRREKPGSPGADADDFEREMADVVRLPPDPRRLVRVTRSISAPRAAPPPAPRARIEDEDGSESGFVATGVDGRQLLKLKRGGIAPGRMLDLHGQTAAGAVASVIRFIDSADHRHRCVCIVHGRGVHSEGNVPILKARVREALRRHRAVLAYTDAPRADGGTGAVYVLLRK